MPFHPSRFQASVTEVLGRPPSESLAAGCAAYAVATTPLQKARAVRDLMVSLDEEVGPETGRAVMERCACIGQGVIDKALALQREAHDLDDLLARLNAAGLGGGHLRREADGIHAAYDHCYCGSVSKTREPVPATYCACSCGWYQRLFEALLRTPVEVTLLASIIQGDPQCRFVITT